MSPEEAEVRLNIALLKLLTLVSQQQQEQALKIARELGSGSWLRGLLRRR